MVDRKNLLITMMISFVVQVTMTLLFVLVGYSLCFGDGRIIGNLDYIGLQGVGAEPNAAYAPNLPQITFMLFQMKFAIITPGSDYRSGGREGSLPGVCLFSRFSGVCWYIARCAHCIWGQGGWLHKLGGAGFCWWNGHSHYCRYSRSGVGYIAKAAGIWIQAQSPDSFTLLTMIGSVLLWFGWFGFNGGSALSAGYLATCTHWSHRAWLLRLAPSPGCFWKFAQESPTSSASPSVQ